MNPDSNKGKKQVSRLIPSGHDKKNPIVSIMITESTATLLGLENTRLEDIATSDEPYTCQIVPGSHKFENSTGSKIWFKNPGEASKFYIENVISDFAFFINGKKFDDGESVTSVTSEEDEDYDDDDELEHERPVKEDDGVDNPPDETTILEKQHVYIRPLVTVRSVAHENKLKCDGNVIYVSLLDSEVLITSSGWINVCRICHGGESVGSLLSPCRCRGSIALTHLECLERWLKESANSHCELCQHHFEIIRQPKYSIPWSVFVFLRHPGDHIRDLLFDLFAFVIYTPSAITSTYMLMLLCESFAKSNANHSRNICGHVMVFSAIFGMAAIDFTYSSWLMVCLQRHREAWREWYKNTCELKLILPEYKQKHERKNYVAPDEPD